MSKGKQGLPQSAELPIQFLAGQLECGRAAVRAVMSIITKMPLFQQGFHLLK